MQMSGGPCSGICAQSQDGQRLDDLHVEKLKLDKAFYPRRGSTRSATSLVKRSWKEGVVISFDILKYGLAFLLGAFAATAPSAQAAAFTSPGASDGSWGGERGDDVIIACNSSPSINRRGAVDVVADGMRRTARRGRAAQ